MSTQEPPDDATRPIPRRSPDDGADQTRQVEPPPGSGEHASTPAGEGLASDEPADEPSSSRARTFAIGAFGAVIGFIIAFVVVALGLSDPAPDGQLAAAQEEIEQLEASLEERDAQVAELEARLVEAEAAAGARDEDAEAQRQALDERATILDERQDALEERAAALERRADELDERERAIADREDADDGAPLPIDEETAEGIIDRIVEQIRDLFQR